MERYRKMYRAYYCLQVINKCGNIIIMIINYYLTGPLNVFSFSIPQKYKFIFLSKKKDSTHKVRKIMECTSGLNKAK